MLTSENYTKGLLIDEELMAGVSETPQGFAAFVLSQTTAEYLGYQVHPTLETALSSINQIPRNWKFEASGGCGGCEDGSCGKGPCSQTCQTTGVCELNS